MPFKYCCFISYPHGRENRIEPFIKDLVDCLKNELSLLTTKPVFIDYDFMPPGVRLEPVLGEGMCKSVCMILIYTPLYFDKDHIWCARELKAMHDLEEKRFELLSERGEGLIIPIVLRDMNTFPAKLKAGRKFVDFESIKVSIRRKAIWDKYAGDIKEIAKYIFQRCRQLEEIESQLENCHGYCLPDSNTAEKFVETILETPVLELAVPFPGRS